MKQCRCLETKEALTLPSRDCWDLFEYGLGYVNDSSVPMAEFPVSVNPTNKRSLQQQTYAQDKFTITGPGIRQVYNNRPKNKTSFR